MICKVDDCDSQSYKKSYCNKHYIRLRRHGDATYSKHNDICIVLNCKNPHYSKKYCKVHYRRIWKNNSLEKKSLRKYEVDHDFFSRDNESSFYWAGFLAADGWICKSKNSNTYYINLTLAKKDEAHLIKYKEILKAEYPIKQRFSKLNGKEYPRVDLSMSSKKMFEDLSRFGIVPRKSLSLVFPEWLINHPLVHHFIRGYFDGDGTIYKTYGKCITIGMLGTNQFLNAISLVFSNKLGINHKLSKNRNGYKIFELKYGGNKLPKSILFLMYKDASVFLERKKLKFDQSLFDNICI